MVYNDTDLKNGIIQRIEDYTQLGDGAITGDTVLLKKMTANVNETLYELITDIMLSQDGFDWDDPNKTDYPIATTPLVAGQRDYQFDAISFLRLKRVDITWDGSTYYKATPFDSSTYNSGLGDDTQTDANFNKTSPAYDPKGFGFWLYPLATAADVANGAKARIEFTRAFTEYVYGDTTKEPPIDRNFHDLIAIGAALKWTGIPDKQYQKLLPKYGERVLTGGGVQFTGGRSAMVSHYNNRNEDVYLSINSNSQQSYK